MTGVVRRFTHTGNVFVRRKRKKLALELPLDRVGELLDPVALKEIGLDEFQISMLRGTYLDKSDSGITYSGSWPSENVGAEPTHDKGDDSRPLVWIGSYTCV